MGVFIRIGKAKKRRREELVRVVLMCAKTVRSIVRLRNALFLASWHPSGAEFYALGRTEYSTEEEDSESVGVCVHTRCRG